MPEKLKRTCRVCELHYEGQEVCPECGGQTRIVCDEPGCKLVAIWGFRTEFKSRYTCHKHWRKAQEEGQK